MYKKNDIVKYTGDYDRNEDYAQISTLHKHEDYWAVDLYLLNGKDRLSCLIDKIRPVQTEEIHLSRLGFKAITHGNGKYFERDGVLITSVALLFPGSKFTFISGLCIGDLRNLSKEEIESFIVKDEFNIETFYSKYPSVQNINQLFAEIASRKWPFDIQSICY